VLTLIFLIVRLNYSIGPVTKLLVSFWSLNYFLFHLSPLTVSPSSQIHPFQPKKMGWTRSLNGNEFQNKNL
jgi:hypothetical protein